MSTGFSIAPELMLVFFTFLFVHQSMTGGSVFYFHLPLLFNS